MTRLYIDDAHIGGKYWQEINLHKTDIMLVLSLRFDSDIHRYISRYQSSLGMYVGTYIYWIKVMIYPLLWINGIAKGHTQKNVSRI